MCFAQGWNLTISFWRYSIKRQTRNITGHIAESKAPKSKYLNLSYLRSYGNKVEFSGEIPVALSSCCMFSKHIEPSLSLGITFLWLLYMFTHVQLLIVLSIVRENSYHAYGVGSREFTRLAQDVGARCVSVWMILQTVQERKEKAQRKGGQNTCWVASLS